MKFLSFNFLIISLIWGCAPPPPKDIVPAHHQFTIYSKQLEETRTINVWIPPGYAAGSDSLPVMYMADGGLLEDFPHIANSIGALISKGHIKPLILVGIENTQRRRDLTGFTEIPEDKKAAPVVGGSEKFRAFIKETLFTEINKRYRTTAVKSIIGESLSGLFVVETLLLTPDMFDNYIAFDPSLWWNNHYLVRTAKDRLTHLSTNQKKLWIVSSDTEDIQTYTTQLAAILKDAAVATLIWKYSIEPKEKHTTIFRATKEQALIWTLGGK